MRAWIVAGVLLGVVAQAEAAPPTIFVDPNTAGGDGFAEGVQSAVVTGSGGVLAGAPLAPVGGESRAGVAYVLDAAGHLVRTLQSPNPTTDGMFGAAVLIAGGDLVVSAPGDVASGTAGAGAVYRFDGTTFALKRIFPPPRPQTGLRFGLPLLFDGNNTLYVGAAETLPPTAANAGAIYALDFGSGAFLRSFEAPAPTAGALFGAAFVLAANTLIVGAPGTSGGGQTGAGAAYLLDATSGALLHPLSSPNPTPAGAFGSAIALLGSTLLVGAPGESGAGQSGGGVVYAFDPASGALERTFTAPIPRAGLGFGAVIAATATSYFAGVPAAPVANLDAAGQVYALDPTKGLSQIFQSPTPRANAHFGASLFLMGNELLIGEPAASGATPKLYLFDLTAPPTPAPSPGIGGGGGTTTTTLPGGCGAAPTFAAVTCNLDALDATVARAGLGRLGSRLRVILTRARARAERAQTARPRRARAALRAVIANVNAFERRWNAASGRLDLGTQKVLLLLAQATRDAARTLLPTLH
jgi:outer membrane protein assembly factor BamB